MIDTNTMKEGPTTTGTNSHNPGRRQSKVESGSDSKNDVMLQVITATEM